MANKLKIVLAQLNFLVGDIENNTDKVIKASLEARDKHKADLIVFPELTLTSYPPEDLLLIPTLYTRINIALKKIQESVKKIDIILGYPVQTDKGYYNAASLIHEGEIIATHYKEYLPNYSVFDEKRYFQYGCSPTLTSIKNIPIAITICEDLWYDKPMLQAAKTGAQLVISLNASPFEKNKSHQREQVISQRAKEGNLPIVYVNLVGGQDELVFDGGSMVINNRGEVCECAPFFEEKLLAVEFPLHEQRLTVPLAKVLTMPTEEERVYKALVLGVRDYIEKNHFPGAIIGLSGGIDSALTLAIAVDAIGKDRVAGLLMPSRYTADISIALAKQQAEVMGVQQHLVNIEPMYNAFLWALAIEFAGRPADTTEQNIQARIRGILLMAYSNKMGKLVLSTGNKSEMAVGYSTLYGDMVGGFCVLKDVAKMMVYRLAAYRNNISPVIPQAVIDRAPTAELAPNQKDEDTLPPYSILDAILEKYVEQDESYQQIVAAGFDPETVKKVIKMIDRNEYKRRQAPPGVKITSRAFGRDRRYPITSGFTRFLS